MNPDRLRRAFERRSEGGGKLFLPYLCAGDPDPATSLELFAAAAEGGADVIEVGVPYSDPLADGPTIQRAAGRSLAEGTRLSQVFELVESFREDHDVPLVLMTYYNPIFRFGEERFLDRAAAAGADGVLVVDLPPEEGGDFFEKVNDRDLHTVLLATPTTPGDRLKTLGRLATGFLYCVTVTGVTGVRAGYSEDLHDQLDQARRTSEAPTVMGFGVSDYASVEPYLDAVDGVVSGSYLVEGIEEALPDRARVAEEVRRRVESLSRPLHDYRPEGASAG